MANNSDQQLLKKQASFIQHSLPGLEAGTYQVEVQQILKHSDGTDITGEGLPSLTRKFSVAGARYTLDRNAIHSVFPPAGAVGEFSNSLAHVVLNAEKLPWLRSPYIPKNRPEPKVLTYETTINGKSVTVDYDQDIPSWLSVMLLSPSDLDGANLLNVVKQGTVQNLVPATMQIKNGNSALLAGTMPANGYSIFSYLLDDNNTAPVDPGAGFTPATVVKYIDVPFTLFNAIAPSMADLSMMAHVRAVEMANKPIAHGQTVNPVEQYSLVIGNRLPESQPTVVPGAPTAVPPLGSNLALLISLESMELALRNHSGTTFYDTNIANQPDGFVRLPVLHQWSFTSLQNTGFAFETMLKSLNGRKADANNTVTVPNPQLRVPDPPVYNQPTQEQTVVQKMLASGYYPMNHLARIPDAEGKPIQTLSWYRGPLVPDGAYTPAIAFLADDNVPAIYAADQLLRFDPEVGMYDVAYALAWELGRLLALQNKDFSVALFQWKKKVAQQYRMLLDADVLDNMFADLLQVYNEDTSIQSDPLVLQKMALSHLQKIASAL
ncbi:hypothetical protein [Chitinophaga ginsengisoli]|uniref:Uncharacterized protein n=1 Tax=Chitinophaga ginsengisoli TaxID=363837 RepID=A0A2P8G4W2_9BACT|nr:hypothetical protein [Chitinophaga ginsengisoli]PSL29020.1 hypothetical protein CLV42_107166 [Chitinophaga ginsengisoli]